MKQNDEIPTFQVKKYKIHVHFLLFLVVSLILAVICLTTSVTASSIHAVDDDMTADYSTIQAAVNNASPGDTILVYPGTYIENVNVSKSLRILSKSGNSEDTIVNPANTSNYIFYINVDNVTINGFNISGATSSIGIYLKSVDNCVISNNCLTYNKQGIVSDGYEGFIIEGSSIIILTGDNNTIYNNEVSHNSDEGIFFQYGNNNNFTSNIVTDNGLDNIKQGIELFRLNNTIVQKNVVSQNSWYGIHLSSSNNNTLIDNNASNNYRGIFIDGSDINILENNVAFNNNDEGIMIVWSYLNTLTNNTANGGWNGIHIYSSNNNTVYNNDFSENGIGIELAGYSSDNTLFNNRILHNTYGIRLWDSSKNLIYNNHFNNSQNTGFVGNNTDNIWNATRTTGANILGGPFIGGNYWSTPSDTGFSQTNTDMDADGLCDSVNILDSNNTDYLPVVDTVIEVDDDGGKDYTTINEAVNNAFNGYTVLVYPGTYSENVEINKNLNIVSKSGNLSDTVIRSSSSYHVISINANDVNIEGFNITGASNLWACVYLNYTNNCTISSNSLNDDYYGIKLNYANNCTLANNTILNPANNGIRLFFSYNNTLKNNIVEYNKGYYEVLNPSGIYLHYSGNNILDNNFVSGIQVGLELSYSNDNVVRNNNASFNDYEGISLDHSHGNLLHRNTMMNNAANFTGMGCGLALLFSENNTIYDNLFNNKNNADTSTSDSNLWNITRTPGTNIIGGSYLGGNFWAKPDGTGFSQTQADEDNDGICDYANILNLNNTDHLPLVSDNQDTEDTSVTSTSSNSEGGGGGGGGGTTGEKYENIQVKDVLSIFVNNNDHIIYEFTEEGNSIKGIEFDSLKNSGKIQATIEVLKGKSSFADIEAPGNIYQQMNIWVGKDGFVNPENIENLSISFRVEKSWMDENSIKPDTIMLYRYSEDNWNSLPTSVADEDDEYVYFESETPGFSPFAISKEIEPEEVFVEEEILNVFDENEDYEDSKPKFLPQDPPTEKGEYETYFYMCVIGIIFLSFIGTILVKKEQTRKIIVLAIIALGIASSFIVPNPLTEKMNDIATYWTFITACVTIFGVVMGVVGIDWEWLYKSNNKP